MKYIASIFSSTINPALCAIVMGHQMLVSLYIKHIQYLK